MSEQKRILIAVVLSFVFFIFYDYFFIQNKLPTDNAQQQKTQQINSKQNTPPISTTNTQAPTVATNSSPVVSRKLITNTDNDKLISVKSDNFEINIDTLGRISQVFLKNKEYENINLLSKEFVRPVELRFADVGVNQEAFSTQYTSLHKNITLKNGVAVFEIEQVLSSVTIKKQFSFYDNGTYTVSVTPSQNIKYFITPGYRPDAALDDFAFHGVLLQLADETLELIDDGDFTSTMPFQNAKIVAGVDKYFTTMFYDFEKGLSGTIDTYQENPLIFVSSSGNATYNGYIGAKNYLHLKNINTNLTKVIDYGFITFIAKPIFEILSYINSHIGNWGWSIVLLTILIRTVLYPLTYKGMVSMNKIKELAPKVKEVQEKYKNDKQRASAAMMEIYRKNGANPMGGCFPFLLQIPIFFAIYRTLINAIELKGSEWILWIDDLSLQDPYFVLPILMGASMYLQQVLTPNTIADPMQQKIFKFLPLVFTLFFLTFASGLVLYWVINNIFSVAQQYYINRMFAKKKLERHEKHLDTKNK